MLAGGKFASEHIRQKMKQFYLHHKADLIRIGATAIALGISLSGVWKAVISFDIIAIAATLIGGFPMFKEAFEAIRQRRMTMELSMSIAVLATLLISQYRTGLAITLFVLVAELLEHLTVDNGRNVLKKLADLLPQAATIRKDDKETTVPINTLQPGDQVIVRPGTRIPVDGIVTKGNSFVDQAAITGESLPVEKTPGKEVLAGTVNQSGVLELKATSIGRETRFGKIIQVIEAAQEGQAPIEKTADKLAARLVYFALAGAVLTYIITRNMTATIAALVVAGACGVAAGTPLAILAGIGRCAREGIIVKGGIYLEQLAHLDTVVLDKTGTLTLGQPKVIGILPFNGRTEQQLLQILATGEQHSEHPLAQCILDKAKQENVYPRPYEGLEYLPGKGLSVRANGHEFYIGNNVLLEEKGVNVPETAQDLMEDEKSRGYSIVLIADKTKLVGGVTIADTVRPEASSAISTFRDYSISSISLLSGDAGPAVEAMGRALNLDEAIGDMLPEDKLEYIKRMKTQGRKVMMVGDGINDAPALVEATVGVAMGAGTDIAFESADLILPTNNLLKVAVAMSIGRQVMNVIHFNFWGTVIVDSIGIVLAFCGWLSPMGAAMIHVSSELLFILNSARLFKSNQYLGIAWSRKSHFARGQHRWR